MASNVHSTIPRLSRIARSAKCSCRRLHLDSRQSQTLLEKYGLSTSEASSSIRNQDTWTLRLLPSRAFHKPVLVCKSAKGTESTLELDINNEEVDSGGFRVWASDMHVEADQVNGLHDIVQKVWKAWRGVDAIQIACNVSVRNNAWKVESPTVEIDNFAFYRQPDLAALAPHAPAHPLEKQADQDNLFYVKHKGGNIGCYGYGAGNGMATLDVLASMGAKPANFLDGGGGATPRNVQAALEVLAADTDVRAIFINAFGGLTKVDLIAKGLLEFAKAREAAGNKIAPVIARLRGTGEQDANDLLNGPEGLPYIQAVKDLEEAALAVARLAT